MDQYQLLLNQSNYQAPLDQYNYQLTIDRLTYQPLQTLLNECQNNPNLNRICNSDELWLRRTLHEFPTEAVLPPGQSWKEYYLNLSNNVKPVEVFINDRYANTIKVVPNKTISQIKTALSTLISYPGYVIVYVNDQKKVIGFSVEPEYTTTNNTDFKTLAVTKVYIYTDPTLVNELNNYFRVKNLVDNLKPDERVRLANGTLIGKKEFDNLTRQVRATLQKMISS